MRVCWSLAASLRKQVANHHKRLGLRVLVVSVMEKAAAVFQLLAGGERRPSQVRSGKTNANELPMTRRRRRNDVKTVNWLIDLDIKGFFDSIGN